MAKTRTLRLSNRIIVLDGINPLRFVLDGDKSLYQFDADGNIVCVGEWDG